MDRPRRSRLFLSLLTLAAVMSGQAISAGTATAAPARGTESAAGGAGTAAVRVLYYDASRAAEFVAAVDRGARNWNNSVTNVRLERARPGVRVNVTVVADNGWPRAQTRSLGNGRIWMGRQAVNDGHYPPRIAAHEFGHLLGLPDRRTGRCRDLMSGASAGTSCRNDLPNPAEIREVEENFAGAALTTVADRVEWHVWGCFEVDTDRAHISRRHV